jgi:transposase
VRVLRRAGVRDFDDGGGGPRSAFGDPHGRGDDPAGTFPIIVIQEAGLDGFWIHRVLQSEGIESHVVAPRRRQAAPSHRRPPVVSEAICVRSSRATYYTMPGEGSSTRRLEGLTAPSRLRGRSHGYNN